MWQGMSETEEKEKKAKVDKYKVIFDFYKSECDSLRNEYYKVEDKASKYLTSLSVLSGVFLLLFKGAVEDIECNLLDLFLIFLLIMAMLSFASSWRFIFMAMKPVKLKSIPFNNKNIEYFDGNDLDIFYYSMTKQYVEVIESYKSAIGYKTSFLVKAFKEVKCSGLILLVLLSFILTVKVIP